MTLTTMRGQLAQHDALNYMLAGNATFTIVDTVNARRFTYRIKAPQYDRGEKIKLKDTPIRFCSLLNGPDNETAYAYFAFLKLADNSFTYIHGGKKARAGRDADSVKLFELVLAHLRAKRPLDGIEIYHEGTCGCCGRKLTVPESITKGIGPVCEIETFKNSKSYSYA